MPDILLTTLNARYQHCAFGLRYLRANLGELRPRSLILEFDISQRPVDVAEALLAQSPKIIGFGVYIWNTTATREVMEIIKRIRAEVVLIAGGPEASYELERNPILQAADYILTGEADLSFAGVCAELLSGQTPSAKVIASGLPDFSRLALPYDEYQDEDISKRIIYVEASRGCPFSCEFCLSSLDIPVRQAPQEAFLASLRQLLNRGTRQFKFVDRTFNLNVQASRGILEFLLAHYENGLFFHFEMVPDRLPEALREVITRFPAGALQFEVGVQTFNPEVGSLIKRRQDYERLAENLLFLRQKTGVHIHADLIAGLPGESWESFGAGFDRLVALGPQEIQVGILKCLRGTPISRHDHEWEMIYSPQPPYEILQNRLINFERMQELRRFARYWDLVGNSGNFVETTSLLLRGDRLNASPFASFMAWSGWLHRRVGRTDSIALIKLMELLFRYLTDERKLDPHTTATALWHDYQRGGRNDKPAFLRDFLPSIVRTASTPHNARGLPKRQARHIG
jgi:radical SAM superfamily enzyme YgiQ (UPF0313 family)